jgi:hypothetical protein
VPTHGAAVASAPLVCTQDQPTATVHVGPGAGDYAAFQPGAGNSMGLDDLKVVEARDFVDSIRTGTPRGATLEDAVTRSVDTGAWTTPSDR